MMVVVGLSHRTAPLEIREKLALPREQLGDLLRQLVDQPELGEVLCVSTCNRVEIIAVPRENNPQGLSRASDVLRRFLEEIARSNGGGEIGRHLYAHRGYDAALHLFRVASSLDSIVVGEPQILGQVKEAFEEAQAAGTAGTVLTRVVSRALHAAKRVRSETAIGEGQVSVSSVAVDLARQIFGALAGRVVLLIGAGEMAEAAAQSLEHAGARLVVVNRSHERGVELAQRVGGVSCPWSELDAAVLEADVVISSTSSRGFVLPRELVARSVRQRRGRALFLIDIAVPRDIDPDVNSLDNVFLYDIDDLEGIVQETRKGRAIEAQKAESIVAEEVRALDAWIEARGVTPTIVALRTKVRATLQTELERSLAGRLRHLHESDRAALNAMLDAAVNKLLHAPTTHLRKAASEPRGEQMARMLRDLFDLPEVSIVADAADAKSSKKN
ncbi:MAG: glutamyl-tRNA reductase [Myxococcales bacterium]|nr:glutamyl-tRNA reductase [Polyangiaceae bacterium]MDW8248184.1 glutamyl-tRNA reductase [Myxococcales bacterium]